MAGTSEHTAGYIREVDLEVLVEAEAASTAGALILLGFLLSASHHTSLLVVTNTLLEEVGLTSQRDVVHEVEGIGGVEVLLVSKGDQETIGDELNVLTHQIGVHAKKSARKSVSQKLLLNGDSFHDNVLHNLGVGAVVQVREEETSKVSVETLITRDKLVGECKTGHQATLLQPEDRGEGSREEDTLNSGKGHKTLAEGRLLILDPADSPIGLLANARNYLVSVTVQ